MTRSSGDPEYGLLPASTKFERDWIAYEVEAQAAHEEQAQAHVAPAEEQEREPTSTLPKPASTLPVKVAMAMAEVAKLNAHLSTLLGVAPAHPAPTTQELLERIGAECVEMRRHALKMELRRATSPGLEKKLYTTGLDAQGGINARIRIDSELLFGAILVVQPNTTLCPCSSTPKHRHQ